jgi:hypothetical protein
MGLALEVFTSEYLTTTICGVERSYFATTGSLFQAKNAASAWIADGSRK